MLSFHFLFYSYLLYSFSYVMYVLIYAYLIYYETATSSNLCLI